MGVKKGRGIEYVWKYLAHTLRHTILRRVYRVHRSGHISQDLPLLVYVCKTLAQPEGTESLRDDGSNIVKFVKIVVAATDL